jgi:hypothetical protein
MRTPTQAITSQIVASDALVHVLFLPSSYPSCVASTCMSHPLPIYQKSDVLADGLCLRPSFLNPGSSMRTVALPDAAADGSEYVTTQTVALPDAAADGSEYVTIQTTAMALSTALASTLASLLVPRSSSSVRRAPSTSLSTATVCSTTRTSALASILATRSSSSVRRAPPLALSNARFFRRHWRCYWHRY